MGFYDSYVKRTDPARFIKEFLGCRTELNKKYTGKPSKERFDGIADENDFLFVKSGKSAPFRSLNITDPHFADFDARFFLAFESIPTVKKLVSFTKPDLITVTGDIVCSDGTHCAIDRFCDLMESFGIPWAPVFGNHDREGNCDKDYLAERMMSCPHCLFKKGDPQMGVGNYVVVISPDNTLKNAESAFIMMDSHGSQPNELQKQWLSAVCEKINASSGGKAELSVFLHIPIPEYHYAYEQSYSIPEKKWKSDSFGFGELHEKVCCEHDENGIPINRGFFDILKKNNVRNVICGHEHRNDFSVKYDGIRLTYTLKLGYASGWQWGFNGGSLMTVGESGIESIEHITKKKNRLITIEKIRCL